MGAVTEAVIQQILENRARFEDFCFSLTPEELQRPVPGSTWLVRDFAAHLAMLDPALQQLFEATARGERMQAADGAPFDVDAHNEELVAARRTWTMPQVFDEGRPARAALIATLRTITDDQAKLLMHFAGDAKRAAGDIPFGLFLSGWAWHDPIHVADMLRALPARAHSDLQYWLENPFVKGYQSAMNPG